MTREITRQDAIALLTSKCGYDAAVLENLSRRLMQSLLAEHVDVSKAEPYLLLPWVMPNESGK